MVNEEIRIKVSEYLREKNMSKKQFAEIVDIHRSTISNYINSPEKLSQKVIDEIEDALTNVLFNESPDAAPSEKMKSMPLVRGGALRTVDYLGVLAVCQSCKEYMGLGVVYGRSGFGKTYSLKNFAKGKRVAYIECNESMNARDLIKAIENAVNLPHMTGSIDDRIDCIKDYFNANDGYLLIIDEADKLITKYTQKKAEILRNIYDQSDIGMILAGEPALERMIRRYIPRMANRIDFAYELKGLLEDEVLEYVTSSFEWSDEAVEEICRRATNERTGCFRLLNRTYENVIRLANEYEEIGIDTVRKASAMMLL